VTLGRRGGSGRAALLLEGDALDVRESGSASRA
jgi:hypothetical protein